MRNNDEEAVALSKRPKRDNDENEEEEIEEPFKISKKGLDTIMNKYLSRRLDEDIMFIERKGGIKFLEEALCTNFQRGLNDNDAFVGRIKAFDSNERAPEDPLSIILLNRLL